MQCGTDWGKPNAAYCQILCLWMQEYNGLERKERKEALGKANYFRYDHFHNSFRIRTSMLRKIFLKLEIYFKYKLASIAKQALDLKLVDEKYIAISLFPIAVIKSEWISWNITWQKMWTRWHQYNNRKKLEMDFYKTWRPIVPQESWTPHYDPSDWPAALSEMLGLS